MFGSIPLNNRIHNVGKYFITLLKSEFIKETTTVYELKVNSKTDMYRLIGIDLIFEIEPTKIVLLQVLGVD